MAERTAGSEPRNRGGRPPKLNPGQVQELLALVRERPSLSLDDIVWAFRKQSGIALSAETVRRYLRESGFQRVPRKRDLVVRGEAPPAPVASVPAEQPRKYGYGDAHRDPGDEARYPCGLTDSEWEEVRDLFDRPGRPGRPAKYPRRAILDACIYVLRSGCSWRMLPKDLPPWPLVYRTFRRWLARDLFEEMYDRLRSLWRSRERRNADPTAIILDSQSVKTSPQGGPKGYDRAKKVKGRKRHLVTDTLGLLIAVLVTTGSTTDRAAAPTAVELAVQKVPGIGMLYVDGGYSGECARALRETHDIEVEVVRNPRNRWHEEQLPLFEQPSRGFVVLPKRWVIERTNAWNDRPRRMAKDHDRLLAVSTAWIWLAEGRRLLRRLTTSGAAEGS